MAKVVITIEDDGDEVATNFKFNFHVRENPEESGAINLAAEILEMIEHHKAESEDNDL